MAALAFQTSQTPAGVAKGLASTFEVVVHRLQPIDPALLLLGAFFFRRLFDEKAFLGSEIDAVAHLRHQRSLAAGQAVELVLESERLGAGLFGGNVCQEPSHLIAQPALVVDQAV